MRILLLVFFITITSICNGFAVSYQIDIEKCDKQFEQDMGNNITAAQMIAATDVAFVHIFYYTTNRNENQYKTATHHAPVKP